MLCWRSDVTSMWTALGSLWSVVHIRPLMLSHQQPPSKRHRCTVSVDQDPRVCHDAQGDIMTDLQLALARLFGLSLWLLRTRLVHTVATWVMRVIMCFVQYTLRPIPTRGVGHISDRCSVWLTQHLTDHLIDQFGRFFHAWSRLFRTSVPRMILASNGLFQSVVPRSNSVAITL